MPSSVFFLVASLWTAVAKPLLGGTGDDYNFLLNNGFQNSDGSFVVGPQDIASNQYSAEPLPVLSIPGAEPFEITTAPAGLNENTFGAPLQDSMEPTSMPFLSEVQPVMISDGELIPLEHNSQTTFMRVMSTITNPGNNPCSGQDVNLGCCTLTYESKLYDEHFSCEKFKGSCPANRAYCCPISSEYNFDYLRTCIAACPQSNPNSSGSDTTLDRSDNCKTAPQSCPPNGLCPDFAG